MSQLVYCISNADVILLLSFIQVRVRFTLGKRFFGGISPNIGLALFKEE